MEDTPRQVNAAQFAARKIKAAKSVTARHGNTGMRKPGLTGPTSFGGQDASSGGGLFGGGFAPPTANTFDFNIPSSISFGNNSGNTTPFGGSDTEQDARADTTGEEAARRNKPFQIDFAQSHTVSQQSNNSPQRTPLSALGQPNGLPAAPEDGKNSLFQFGRSPSPATTNVFNFGSTSTQQQQQQQPANPFSFSQPGQTRRETSPFRFGTPPAQNPPASNPFSFGQNQNSTQAQPASTGISFGSKQAAQPPSSSTFSFGQVQSQPQPATSSISFGSTPTPTQPTNNIFGQSPALTSTPANNIFGQQNQQLASSNIFGQAAQKPILSNNLFGQLNTQATNSNTIFAQLNPPKDASNNIFNSQVRQSTPPTQNLFGEQKPAPANNLFGGNNQSSLPATNIFGSVSNDSTTSSGSTSLKPSTESSNIFGSSQPSHSLLGGQSSEAAPNIFGNKASSTTTSNIFGGQPQSSGPASNLFGHLNQPTPQVTSAGASEGSKNVFGASQNVNGGTSTNPPATSGPGIFSLGGTDKVPPSPKPAPATLQSIPQPEPSNRSNLFNQNAFNNSSGATQQPDSILPSVETEGFTTNNKQSSAPEQLGTSNSSSLLKPAEAPEAAGQPVRSGLFQDFPQPASDQSTTANIFAANMARKSISPPRTSSAQSTALANDNTTEWAQKYPKVLDYVVEMREMPDSEIEPKCPTRFTPEQKKQFFAAYRLRALNKGIKSYINSAPPSADLSPALRHYLGRRNEILGNTSPKRKLDEVENQQGNSSKRSKPSEGSVEQHIPRTSSPLKTQPVLNGNGQERPLSPEKASRLLQPPVVSPSKPQQAINNSATPKVPPPSTSLFGQRTEAPPSPSPRGKRKAEVQITSDHPTEEEALEHQKSKAATPNGRSFTSSVFQSILEKPDPAPTNLGSPERKAPSPTKTQSPEKPRFNPFASLPMPRASPFTTTPAATKSSAFSPNPMTRSPASSTNILGSKTTTQASNPLGSKTTDSIVANDSTILSAAGASSSTASTSVLFSSKPATLSTDVFTPKPALTEPASNPFSPKPATAAPASNPFAPKPSSVATESSSSLSGKEKVLKPPTFGTPVNFMAQFGQKSQKSMADAEADAMEREKLEDMDSDEDEAEWEARYKAKRETEKKATEEIAKTKRATFVPGKGFTFVATQPSDSDKAPSETARSGQSSIFGRNTSAPNPTTNLFAPINRSDTTSPGAASSRGSSVFDGVTSGKPISFGTNNIFGHLSDVDSGADSGKGNEADDDTDGESTDSNAEDDEKKDATYDPSTEEASPGTPGTPVEETGSGIASVKKPGPTSIFGASTNSGASTPGGSLFDRITKDGNGNPIRKLPGENKENSSPSGTSIFGGNASTIFNFGKKTPGEQAELPSDKTWKQDSPIKFGASTTSPPAVNVTAPTPTKANQFAGIFGSTVPKSGSPTPTGTPFQGLFGSTPKPLSPAPTSASPFAGIFGNMGPSKSASSLFPNQTSEGNKTLSVGFNFGAGSTATSSLFPSAAGSTATSRATSPGATTDGESIADTSGDPDAEHHEQINLTSGGPGEENEENLHEVRAKALKYEIKDDGSKDSTPKKPEWVVKGLGVLRVLKHKESGSSRILLRADPSGSIVMNKAILGNVTYEATGKTVKLLTAGESGKALETWLLQVKTAEAATELASALEANKKKD